MALNILDWYNKINSFLRILNLGPMIFFQKNAIPLNTKEDLIHFAI
jgi:hypothetical protein